MTKEAIDNMMESCSLCPRRCKVNRLAGQTGYCGVTGTLMAARAGLHMWEEPCISGEKGSGTVFFTGCQLRCVFCQNHQIAIAKTGKTLTLERLTEIFLELQEKGAHNINLVTPTHFVPQIVYALQQAKEQGLQIPVVYNTSSYETVETLKMLEGIVDIYLPDCKYRDPSLAGALSNAPSYFETASLAIAEMVRQVGDPVFDERGMMKKGVIVRHLLLPGHTRDSGAVIRYLYETYRNHIYISMMNQYTPMEGLEQYPELQRKVTAQEYDKIVDYAIDLGVENGFIQEGDTAEESFIPAFDCEGIAKEEPNENGT